MPRLSGDPDAAEVVGDIDRDAAVLRGRLTDLRQAKGEVEARLAIARQAAAA